MDRALISPDDPRREPVLALLRQHWTFTLEHSPPGQCYTFNADELAAPDVTFWSARRDQHVVGMIALKRRTQDFAELKSLHVAASERGTGLGEGLVSTLLESARECGFSEIGLETGQSVGFAPSRRLYERLGFVHGPAFPPYTEGSFSYCMTRKL